MELSLRNELIDAESLYCRYGPMVIRRCRHVLGDEELAADAAQETFVRVLRNGDRLSACHPSSLLYRIATNICLNMLRTIRRRPTVRGEALMDGLADRERMEDRVLDSFVLEQMFCGSKEGTRTAAEMHYVEGRTLAQTAHHVDLSVSGVRKRFQALREQGLAIMGK